ncbi:MAG: Nramp family divalent metal transporter [Candidatus Methylomirabilales bacterium]
MRMAHRHKRRLLVFLSIMGPGIITASVDQDAGGIATYSLAGAQYGYTLLWALFLTTISLAVVQEMGSRMGVVTGKGLGELIRERYGVRPAVLILVILVLANLANTIAEFAGVAAAFEIFGVPRFLSVPLTACFVSWLVVQGTYARVERVFLIASALYLLYVVSAVLADPPWAAVLRQTIRPSFQMDRNYLVMLITLVGTTIAPWMQFYLQSSTVDKGLRWRDYKYARLDVIIGAFVASGVAYFIIVACAATLNAHGIRIETAVDAARALEPFAGPYASLFFALGLLNASIFSAAVLPLSTAYATCEALGWETGVDRRPREAPEFFTIYLVMIGIGAATILWPHLPLIPIMFLSQTLNGILLPFTLIIVLQLVNDREIMGEAVNSPLLNLIGWGTAFLMSALTLLLLLTLIF